MNPRPLKIVYYGPPMSGKATNLLNLHDSLDPEERGEVVMLDSQGDRTFYFDLSPVQLSARESPQPRVRISTVHGQVRHEATRKAVLRGLDGLIFVADSQRDRQASNAQSFLNLERNLRPLGKEIDDLPIVLQFNKRDLEDVVPEQQLIDRWQPSGLPLVMACALRGENVVESFQRILAMARPDLAGLLGAVR